jgi:prepilin signal peptidase PulO-like enzyme (type II secretory pathway)
MAQIADTAVIVVFIGVLVVLSAIDVRRRIVPNRIVLPAAAVVLVLRTIAHPSVVWLVAGLGASLFLLVAAVAKPDGMGMGDVKLALLLGFAVGRTVPIALLVGLLAAAVPSLVLLVRHGAAGRTIGIPFAPFLAVGGVCALAAGGGFGS